MPCDKCHGHFQECSDDDLNEIRFGETMKSFVVCDRCNESAFEYLSDFF